MQYYVEAEDQKARQEMTYWEYELGPLTFFYFWETGNVYLWSHGVREWEPCDVYHKVGVIDDPEYVTVEEVVRKWLSSHSLTYKG